MSPRHSLTGDFTRKQRTRACIHVCWTVFHSCQFFFTVYDTVHLNYESLGIVCGLNIAGRGEQMEMWVRDKGRHSLLMKKRVSDSLWLAEGLFCAHRPGSSLWGVEVREGRGGGSVEVAEPQKVSDYTTAMRPLGYPKPDQSGDVIYYSRVHLTFCLDCVSPAPIIPQIEHLFLSHTHTCTQFMFLPYSDIFPCFLDLQKPNCIWEE